MSAFDPNRYHRQMLLPGMGSDGQQRLGAARVVLIGCGALGTVVAESLVRAGVGGAGGWLRIVDRDLVELTNLQRQTLFDEQDAAESRPKAIAAAARLAKVNSGVVVEPVVADLNPRSAERLVAGAEVVIDGTDNFGTRYLINDVCVKQGVPLVYGGVVGTTGMTMTIVPGRTPCLRCIFPEPPAPGSAPTCDTAGVLGPMAGVVASIQSAEAMKVALRRFDLLRPVLSQFDIWNNVRRTIDLSTIDRSACPCCAKRNFAFLDTAAAESTSLCGADAVQVLPLAEVDLDLHRLAAALAPHGEFAVAASGALVRGRLKENGSSNLALTVFRDGRAIVRGTTDPIRARSIYARYVGA